jgi:hypothetical protein
LFASAAVSPVAPPALDFENDSNYEVRAVRAAVAALAADQRRRAPRC